MYEIFEQLLQSSGFTAADVCKATGIGQSTISNWKNRRNLISGKNAQLIADFFHVSVDFLMTGKEKEFPEFEREHIELIKLYSKLNEEQKKTVMTFLRSLAPQC